VRLVCSAVTVIWSIPSRGKQEAGGVLAHACGRSLLMPRDIGAGSPTRALCRVLG
jgi:hypothetical protein